MVSVYSLHRVHVDDFDSKQINFDAQLPATPNQYGGGAIFIQDATVNATIEDCLFVDNAAVRLRVCRCVDLRFVNRVDPFTPVQ